MGWKRKFFYCTTALFMTVFLLQAPPVQAVPVEIADLSWSLQTSVGAGNTVGMSVLDQDSQSGSSVDSPFGEKISSTYGSVTDNLKISAFLSWEGDVLQVGSNGSYWMESGDTCWISGYSYGTMTSEPITGSTRFSIEYQPWFDSDWASYSEITFSLRNAADDSLLAWSIFDNTAGPYGGGPVSGTWSIDPLETYYYRLDLYASVEAATEAAVVFGNQAAAVQIIDADSYPIPEPSTIFLLGCCMAALVWGRRKFHKM